MTKTSFCSGAVGKPAPFLAKGGFLVSKDFYPHQHSWWLLYSLSLQSKSGGITHDTAAFVIRSFSSLFPLLSALSILQILSAPLGFQRIFGFQEVSTGQRLLFHVGNICVRLLFCHISPFSIQLSRYIAAQGRREILLILNHRSFVYRCCRFSSASTSGGIRSTSL